MCWQLLFLIFAVTGRALKFCATAEASGCLTNGFPLVRSISQLPRDSYGIPGLSQTTVWNTNDQEDLQFLVIISRPPAKVFIYDDWFTPHTAAKLLFPIFWDEECYQTTQKRDEL